MSASAIADIILGIETNIALPIYAYWAHSNTMTGTPEKLPWYLGVFDAHCHPTDTLASLQTIPSMRAKVLTVMATRAEDQYLVADAAAIMGVRDADVYDEDERWSNEHKIIPAFGWHPWFSHQIIDDHTTSKIVSLTQDEKIDHYQRVLNPSPEDREFMLSLPDPLPLSSFIEQTRRYLEQYPLALIGEVGLDKSCRIPIPSSDEHHRDRAADVTPGGREGRRLTPYRVNMSHQQLVLVAQLRLAGEMQRAVSCHGVQAHGVLFDTLASTWKGYEQRKLSKKERKVQAARAADCPDDEDAGTGGAKPYPPRLCLHSFSGTAETVKQYLVPSIPCDIYFSFSTTINDWTDDGQGKVEMAVRAVPDDRILIESDMDRAGGDMDTHLEQVIRKICAVKQWDLEAGVKQLGNNWMRFVGLSTADRQAAS
ncbi:Cut9-interacting protein scn1 [Oleoguttula sp. CCFEE 5521]